MEPIVTERLLLRLMEPEDVPAFAAYRTHPGVARYQSWATSFTIVFATADDRNHAVHRLFERLGFRCEARHVEADRFKGEWATLRVYALLRREFTQRG